MDYSEQIRLEAQSLGQGTHRTICPSCQGGSSHERSLAIKADGNGNVRWLCFRAMCGIRGGDYTPIDTDLAFKPMPFLEETVALSTAQKGLLRRRHGSNMLSGVTFCPANGRAILPIRGPMGEPRGHVARQIYGDYPPKTINYATVSPFLHWSAYAPYCKDIVVVEDWFSAEHVGMLLDVRAVSLNGTYLSPDDEAEITTQAEGRNLHIALDRDALAKALHIVLRLRMHRREPCNVWMLGRDLKHVDLCRIALALETKDFDLGDTEL